MTSTSLGPRPAALSVTEMTEIVLPQHANRLGTAFGGTVMSWIDVCAAITAQRHAGRTCVTAFVDDLEFLAPARVGDVVRLTARVNAAFTTSLEIEVHLESEDPATGRRTLCAEALLTFVCIDERGKPIAVPPLLADNESDRCRAADAAIRRERRKARKAGRCSVTGPER